MNVTILGGGISGLAAAHYLLKKPNINRIIVIEASNRLGGWMATTRNEDGIIYEHGPRTIRPDGPAGANTLALVEEIGLGTKIRPIKKGHPTTENRLIYANGKLHKLPSPSTSIWKYLSKMDPFKLPLACAGLKDLIATSKPCQDDSLYNFVERRFGKEVAKYAVDPMMRGIFAGDAKELSVHAFGATSSLFDMEQKDGGILKSVVKNKLGLSRRQHVTELFPENESFDLVKKSRNEKWAIWSLDGGLETLIDALKDHLLSQGVEIQMERNIQSLKCDNRNVYLQGDDIDIQCQHSVLALPTNSIANLFQHSNMESMKAQLLGIPYVDVAVVNVEFDGKVDLPTGEGFGLLVPSCETDIPILGIIFDTCAFPQITLEKSQKSVFTVMMGGKWFKSLFGPDPNASDLKNIALHQLKTILDLHQEPTRVVTKIHKDCIAQYTIGHINRVKEIRRCIKEKNMPISIVGSAFDGVGINDAIMSSRKQINLM